MALNKQQKKGLWRGALTAIITLLIIIAFGYVLTLRVPESYYNTRALYTTKGVNVLFVGNSHAIAGLNARTFGEETKTNALNIATTSQTVLSTDLLVKEAVRTQDVDIIFVETFSMLYPTPSDPTYSDALDADSTVFRSVSGLKDKFLAMAEQPGMRRKFDAFLPLFKYHANWKTPEEWHLRWTNSPLMQESKNDYLAEHQDGTRIIPYVMTPEQYSGYAEYKYEFNVNPAMTANAKYWDSIIETCRANDIDVVFVTLPWLPEFVANTNYSDITAAFTAYFAEKGVTYIDFNTMDFPVEYTDFAMEGPNPNQHLNVSGAEKVTAWLADWYNEEKTSGE